MDVGGSAEQCRLLGVKLKTFVLSETSAFGPERGHSTFRAASAKQLFQNRQCLTFPPRARWHADIFFEGSVERSFRFVADLRTCLGNADARDTQMSDRQLHAPPAEIMHWRNTNIVREAIGKDRS